MKARNKTLSGTRVRYFGSTKLLYHLVLESKLKDTAESRATRIRRGGYGARLTHEGGKYQVWESHFPSRR